MGLVGVERADAVVTLTLDRPEKRNALSIELRRELTEALRATSDAVVVLTGAGTAFCAGMDTTQFGGDEENRRALFDSTFGLFEALRACPMPTIAAVNGPALGGGFVLAALCDIRLASPAATFGSTEIRLGIPPSYGSWLRVAPAPLARECAFTGRVLSADEALRAGIVAGVHDDVVGAAHALASSMAAYGARALAMVKEMARAADDASPAAAAERAEIEMFRRALFGGEGT